MKACPSIAAIQAGAAQHYGIRVLDLVSNRRGQRVIWPRHVAMFLCRELTAHSLPAIGRHFGNRDHSAVTYALRRVAQRMGREAGEAAAIAALRASLAGRIARAPRDGEREAILDAMAALLARRKAAVAEIEEIDNELDELGARAWGAPQAAGEGGAPGALAR